MKPVLSVIFVLFLVMVTVHCSSSHIGRINKRYYDAWEGNTNNGNPNEGESVKTLPFRHKGSNKDDPCENKPLWFLKSQRKLGKLSPFYDCIHNHGLE